MPPLIAVSEADFVLLGLYSRDAYIQQFIVDYANVSSVMGTSLSRQPVVSSSKFHI